MSTKCIHCGADCGKNPVMWDEKPFCCNGCVQVYRLLNENKMSNYYDMDNTPGIRVEQPEHDEKYAFLDKDEVKEKFYEFFDDGIAKVSLYIPSIHCASCIWLLENLHKLNKGVRHAAVNFVKKEYTVSFKVDEISLRELVELLVSIHYIPQISLQTLEKKEENGTDKKLLYKVGVAGFVFGNVMLYSLPEYFNGKALGGSLGVFLYWLTYTLTFPMVFYSGNDYLLSAYKNLKKGIVNIDLPIAIGILTLFFVTSYEVISGVGPGYSDSLAGFMFFLLLGKWYQSKTYKALSFDRDYKSFFPVAVTRINQGKEESLLLKDIRKGDELLIRNKELIPADSVLLEGDAVIDYSFVTGESTPIRKYKDEALYAGGVQNGGAIKIKINKKVEQSHLTRLWNQSEDKHNEGRSLQNSVDKISGYFTIVIIVIALVAFGFWLFIGTFQEAILVLTSVLIVACPCALALSLPFTFGNAMRMLGQRGLYIKNTDVIEKLTQVDTLVFDKTGTLTTPDRQDVKWHGEPLKEEETTALASLARQSVHPLSVAIARHFDEVDSKAISAFTEMSGKGVFGICLGLNVRFGSQKFAGKNDAESSKAVGGAKVHVTVNDTYLGYFDFKNAYRKGYNDMLNSLGKNYDMYLLSGDNDAEKEHLSSFFNAESLHFNQNPQDKKDFIVGLQQKGKHVLMTGDGLNDAGAFMASHLALSVADDIYHFSPAGDAIIESNQFKNLNRFIAYAKRSLGVVRSSFIISFFYNVIGLGFAVTGNLSPVVAAILMPVSSISVVAFATFATRFAARKI